MSRIGKLPVIFSSSVDVCCDAEDSLHSQITVKGPKGSLTKRFYGVRVVVENSVAKVTPFDDSLEFRPFWGLYRTILNNMCLGVFSGFVKIIQIQGVGYKAEKIGNCLMLSVGFSHDVALKIPEHITIEIIRNVTINVCGIDKEMVGLFASKIRNVRPPEPYKGKGIMYKDELIVKKEGKKK